MTHTFWLFLQESLYARKQETCMKGENEKIRHSGSHLVHRIPAFSGRKFPQIPACREEWVQESKFGTGFSVGFSKLQAFPQRRMWRNMHESCN
jgi:hypothetical protein